MVSLDWRRAGFIAAVLVGSASPAAQALEIGPKSLPLTVAGVAVQIPVSGSLDVRTEASDVAVAASATGDLQAIQDHALDIARGLRLPSDPCAHKGGLNVVVNHIDEAAITPRETSVVVDLSGRVSVWICKKILGATLKTKIAAGSVSISAPLELFLPNPQTVALRLSGPATVKTDDPQVEDAASALVGDVNAVFTKQLGKLLDAERARAILPPLPGADVTLERAAFAQQGRKLLVRASGRARLTSAALATLLAFVAH